MTGTELRLSRIDKLFVDRDESDAEAAFARRQRFRLTLLCGDDVARSRTLQAALLTAANIAARCFPGAFGVVLSETLASSPLLCWPSLHLSLGDALAEIARPAVLVPTMAEGDAVLVFGDAQAAGATLRVTFDGWVAKVGPPDQTPRMQERDYCSLAGVLAGALALSEVFLDFAEVTITASRRPVALSLWKPGADEADSDALGAPVGYLPQSLWLLGLGHLGNAYIWALSFLPYPESADAMFFLYDFDTVEIDNFETGLLFQVGDAGTLKTRVSAAWLERRGFKTRMIERHFDDSFRCRDNEPQLALCGFDSNDVRRDLGTARFRRVIESGLGATADNFDTLSLHTLPNPRSLAELWPDEPGDQKALREEEQDRVSLENPGYQALGDDLCGRYELAGKAVAVPFVGAVAAAFAMAETLRLGHGGSALAEIRLSLSAPERLAVRSHGFYTPGDTAGITYITV